MMFFAFFKILIQIIKIDKKFFKNSKNFGEASIYFAIIIILFNSLISLIPNTAFIDYMSLNFKLGKVEGPSLRSVVMFSFILWFVKATYVFLVGVILFPSNNTMCNFRKTLILVGFTHVPMFFNLLIINPSLLPFIIITYTWYNISLIVGINIVYSYNNLFKSSLIVLAPFIILLIYFASIIIPGQSNIIS